MSRNNRENNPFQKISPELWLMLAGASGDTVKAQNLLHQPVNWDILLQLAVHHRVYPLVYKTLSRLNNPAVPDHVLGLLRQKYRENAMQAISMTGETIRIVKRLENHGICAVVLKGTPLSWRLYGDITIRPSRDIDILVSTDELKKTIGILENEGYRRIYTEHILTPRQLQIISKKAVNHSNHFVYQHNEKKIYLEIHWKLGNHVHALPLPTGRNIKRIEVAGILLPVLSDEELLLYLILHGAGHGWYRLRWLIDIAMFTQQGDVDWEKTEYLARSFGIQSFLYQYLIMTNQILAMPVPPNLLSIATHDRTASRLARMAMNLCLSAADFQIRGANGQYTNYWPNIYQFNVLTGWKNRFNYILKLFAPAVDDILLISLPDRLYALYYVIRPLTFIGRRLRKLKAGTKRG